MTKVVFLISLFLTSFISAQSAWAVTHISCVSEPEQTVYYFSPGQILFSANIQDHVTLENVFLTLKSDLKMGTREPLVEGKATQKYVRFELYGDHVCSYKITFYKNFINKTKTNAFLDAHCENNHRTSHELSCTLK